MNRRRPRGSRLAVGSSRTRTEGLHARTPARQTRFRSPKLRWCGSAVGDVAEVDPRQAFEGDPPRLGPAHAQVQRAEGHVLEDRRAEELVVGVLEHQADPAADLGRVPRVDLQAVDPDRAAAVRCAAPRPAPVRVQVGWPAPCRAAGR